MKPIQAALMLSCAMTALTGNRSMIPEKYRQSSSHNNNWRGKKMHKKNRRVQMAK